MIITLGSTVLANGPAHGLNLHVGPMPDIRGAVQYQAQVDSVIDASVVTIIPRGNLRGSLSFSVQVLKSSLALASGYATKYPYQVARTGTMTIVESGTTTTYANCIMTDCTAVQNGLTVFISYTITHGAVT